MNLEQKNEKKRRTFYCTFCDCFSGSKSDYNKHILTAKHQKSEGSNKIEYNGERKREKFSCELCDYHASYQSDYTRHLLTAKHLRLTKSNDLERENERRRLSGSIYTCTTCNKEYKSSSGLWNHKKKCITAIEQPFIQPPPTTQLENAFIPNNIPNNILDIIVNIVKTNEDIKHIMFEQMKQQMDYNKETQKQLIELVREPRNTNSNNNNTQTNHFNLHFFLNETCKDAINISEFIENIKIDLYDVENVGRKGYITGITDMIVKNLNDLGMTKRPFHCTDTKRETIYIKDNDKWDKDSETKEKFQRVLNQIYEKNWTALRKWSQANPDIRVLDSKENKLYHKILEQTDCIKGLDKLPETNEKIIRRLSETIKIDR